MIPTILSESATGLQNIYTPFTAKQHLIFCIFGTTIYLIQYYRKGGWHNLLLMLGIDLTYLTQTSLCNTSERIWILGVAELIVLAAAFWFSMKYNKQQKAEKASLAAAAVLSATEKSADEERRDKIEKEAEKADSDIVGSAFEEE